MNSAELRARISAIGDELKAIINTANNEVREMTDEEKEKFNELNKELDEQNEELKALEESLKLDDEEEEEEKENEEEEQKANNNEIKSIKRMSKKFRLLETIAKIANNQQISDEARAVVNQGAEEMRKAGLSFGGQIQLPTNEVRSAITVTAEGEDTVGVDVMDVMQPLRAKNVLIEAGAKFMSNLNGDVVVPVMGASNVTWEGETSAASDGAGTFTSVKLQPKRLTAYVDVSKQFLLQTSESAERAIWEDIVNAINSKLESTILGEASGTTTQPEGIFYNGGSALTVADSYAELLDVEADVEDANVMGECVYIMSNKAKSVYRGTAKGSTTGGFILENGEIDGTKVLATSHVQGYDVAFGDFSNLVIGQWGAVDLTVDPYTRAANGEVRLVVNAFFDAKVARPTAIAIAAAHA